MKIMTEIYMANMNIIYITADIFLRYSGLVSKFLFVVTPFVLVVICLWFYNISYKTLTKVESLICTSKIGNLQTPASGDDVPPAVLLNKSSLLLTVSKINKVGDHSRGRPEGSLFSSYYTEVLGRALLLPLDFSTLPLICTL